MFGKQMKQILLLCKGDSYIRIRYINNLSISFSFKYLFCTNAKTKRLFAMQNVKSDMYVDMQFFKQVIRCGNY